MILKNYLFICLVLVEGVLIFADDGPVMLDQQALVDIEPINETEASAENQTAENDTSQEPLPNAEKIVLSTIDGEGIVVNNTKVNATFKVPCVLNNTGFAPVVEVVNSSKLLSVMSGASNGTCTVVLFYSPWCPFSGLAAPHYNALPRVFPDIYMAAVDMSAWHYFSSHFEIVGVPSLLLFYNGRPAARFNGTEYSLEAFAKFITKATGLIPEGKLFVTSVDFQGPISSIPLKQTDYCLVLAWIFVLVCLIYYFYYSSWHQWLIDAIRNAWREAHPHDE